MRSLVDSMGPHKEAPVGLADMTRSNIDVDASYPMYEDWVPGFAFDGATRSFSQLAELDRQDRESRAKAQTTGLEHHPVIDSVTRLFRGEVRRGWRDLIELVRN